MYFKASVHGDYSGITGGAWLGVGGIQEAEKLAHEQIHSTVPFLYP